MKKINFLFLTFALMSLSEHIAHSADHDIAYINDFDQHVPLSFCDWTKSFTLKDGTIVTHTPEYIVMDSSHANVLPGANFVNINVMISLKITAENCSDLNGYPLNSPFYLEHNVCELEFMSNLIQCGMYQPTPAEQAQFDAFGQWEGMYIFDCENLGRISVYHTSDIVRFVEPSHQIIDTHKIIVYRTCFNVKSSMESFREKLYALHASTQHNDFSSDISENGSVDFGLLHFHDLSNGTGSVSNSINSSPLLFNSSSSSSSRASPASPVFF